MGRAANTQGFGLEELGIPVTKQKTGGGERVPAGARIPNIYACGDVVGPVPVHAHRLAHGVVLRGERLFGRFRKFRVDYSVIPWATFTDPEVARVGLNETEAKEKRIACDVFTYGIDDLDRAHRRQRGARAW